MNPPATQPAKAETYLVDRKGRRYEPAVGPRLKVLLVLIFAAVALLGTTGVYLTSIRLLNARGGATYTNSFTLWMFLVHILVGVFLLAPFFIFGIVHYVGARTRRNRRAIRLGVLLWLVGIVACLSGVALIQLEGMPQLPADSVGRWVTYGLHVGTPLLAVLLYVLHRMAGPKIRWRWGYAWGGVVGVFVVVSGILHLQDPRDWGRVGPREGERYFEPSKARTATGDFIPASALMMDQYCQRCHADIYQDHFHSAHRFSSFNNPAYLFSVRESRKIIDDKGIPRASRWCAGCHDPVPFFSGAFDNPKYDDVNDPTAHAGISCTVCHAITNVNSVVGNAAYTIEEPEHYPFAYSDNAVLQWLNNQLVKAKPDFHKRTFLKPLHRSAEFCSTCHKVSLPVELNFYKEFLIGQNHYDNFLLSGVHGGNARAFYYPKVAETNCNKCHMPLHPSEDFGSKDFDGSGIRKVHNHLFPAANTGMPTLVRLEDRYKAHADGFLAAEKAHAEFLKDGKLRIDIFGLKPGGTIDDPLVAPLRPEIPQLEPGKTYLIEVVIRTLKLGHLFTQGTVDSNEIWVDFEARAGGKVIGKSGGLRDAGPLDEWAHRVNALVLDRHGNRINRRNPQDIFTPLYNHQIPPGAAQVVHYELEVPKDVKGAVELTAKLRYRKFDHEYMSLVYKDKGREVPRLPIVDLCADHITLPVKGSPKREHPAAEPPPLWQRWNDYGIGCLLEGGAGQKKGELRQAAEAFTRMTTLDDVDAKKNGYLNLARVYQIEGGREQYALANEALDKLQEIDPTWRWWTVSWFKGLIAIENAATREEFDGAIADFERIVDPDNQPHSRGFDFRKDYVVLNELAQALYNRSQLEEEGPGRRRFLLRSLERYHQSDKLNPENFTTHYGMHQCYRDLAGMSLPTEEADPATEAETLRSLAATLGDSGLSAKDRIDAAGRLYRGVVALGEAEVTARRPKRPLFDELRYRLTPAFEGEKDKEVRNALAAVLGQLHLELWKIFKPDDQAARIRSEYRLNHPAANHAAEAIVIYDLHRKGAPGLP